MLLSSPFRSPSCRVLLTGLACLVSVSVIAQTAAQRGEVLPGADERVRTSSGRPVGRPGVATTDWYRIEFDGQPAGYESISTSTASSTDVEGSGQALLRRVRDSRIKLKRFGTDLSLSAHLETIEDRDGVLHRWSLRRTAADGSSLERSGTWNSETSGFDLTERIAGSTRKQLLPVAVQPRSPVLSSWIAVASGFTRTLWTSPVLFPETAAVADIQIDNRGPQSLKLPDGRTVATTRWDYWPLDFPDQKSSLWTGADGRVLRVEQPLLGQRLRFDHTNAESALGTESLAALDLQFRTAMTVQKSPARFNEATSQKWRVTVGPTEQLSLTTSDFQTVEQVSPSEVIVTLTKPDLPLETQTAVLTPKTVADVDPAYRQPSRWINSDDPAIQRRAIFAAGSTSGAWDKCQRLTRHVNKHLRFSAFSSSLLSATEINKSLRGDCTEHAVLLTALLRSDGVPARVAIGFVYRTEPESFVPHMWTEAWINNSWLPLDSAINQAGPDFLHLKIADSALGDDVASGTVLFVPLLDFLGRASVAAEENSR